MIIYEVNLTVHPEVSSGYKLWLEDHIKEMLNFKGFKKALFLENLEETPSSQWTVQYFIDSKENLDDYLSHHAKIMREQALDKFSGQFSASRRIFSTIGEFDTSKA